MPCRRILIATTVLLACAASSSAVRPSLAGRRALTPKLNDALAKLAKYDFGGDSSALPALADLVGDDPRQSGGAEGAGRPIGRGLEVERLVRGEGPGLPAVVDHRHGERGPGPVRASCGREALPHGPLRPGADPGRGGVGSVPPSIGQGEGEVAHWGH